jgi:4-hydroxy-tetrahydrodipicolinate synthase
MTGTACSRSLFDRGIQASGDAASGHRAGPAAFLRAGGECAPAGDRGLPSPHGDGEAEAVYAHLLPAATVAMKSVESMVSYGKRVSGRRAGIPIHDRAPSLRPTPFGLEMARKHAERLKPYREPAG